MDIDTEPSSTLISQFHLGVSADGNACMMVFVDDEQHAMKCVAEFSEFRQFVASLCEIANEMARRQMQVPGSTLPDRVIEVESGSFTPDRANNGVAGTLVASDGTSVGMKMSASMAAELSRALLLAAPARRAS